MYSTLIGIDVCQHTNLNKPLYSGNFKKKKKKRPSPLVALDLRLTSVPYLDSAVLACCLIFSLYICAARLLYLALVSFVEQPCWRKKAVFKQREREKLGLFQACLDRSTLRLDSAIENWQKCFFSFTLVKNLWCRTFVRLVSTYCVGIASNLHTSKLKPVPVGI